MATNERLRVPSDCSAPPALGAGNVWAMLDWAHEMTLRAVASGGADDSPALRTLIKTGLVAEAHQPGSYILTPAGQAALAAGKRPRLERFGLQVAGAGLVILAVTDVIGWVT